MRLTLITASCALFALVLSSCSSAKECSPQDAYTIEYSNGGGVTGMERGMTIDCSGRVTMWDKNVNSPRVSTDSLVLKSSSRKALAACMADAAVYAYTKNDVGNYTTRLVLTKNDQHTVIAYPSSTPPADLPASIQKILSEISSIHK